jgi:hypothetical protein
VSSNLDGNKTEYLRDLLSWETDGERTPIQVDPDPILLDERTPVFLRRQAA